MFPPVDEMLHAVDVVVSVDVMIVGVVCLFYCVKFLPPLRDTKSRNLSEECGKVEEQEVQLV